MRSQIDFLLGGEAISVSGIAPELTVLEWLRARGRVGTKEGCAEGDCGACTVVVAERDGERLTYRAINSCIQPMASLDGRQLITVEDLAGTESDGSLQLHPVQRAMVDHHASQCGFCTPGFVMSMFAMTHQPEPPDIREALAGNLCRCTGYMPILDASRRALMETGTDRFSQDEPQTLRKLEALAHNETIRLSNGERQMLAPRTLDDLLGLLVRYPDSVLVAGATDVGLWLTKRLDRFETMIYIPGVAELRRIEAVDGFLEIGAAVTCTDAMPVLTGHFPGLHDMLVRFGGVQVRNAGTIGGNIANGSPIGDMPPPLIALGARLVLASAKGRREIGLEDFFLEYGEQDLRPGECVLEVRIPLALPGQLIRAYKLSKRIEQDISAVLGAYSLRLDGDTVDEIRIAYGGMAGIPARARHCEEALNGKPWNEESVERACAAMTEDFEPLTDWRASAAYRMLAAQNLLRRFFMETTSGE